MEACILICKTKKTHEQKGKVLFINALYEVTRKNSQSFLEKSHIEKIADAYKEYKSIDGFSKIASIGEIMNNGFLLSLPLYVENVEVTVSSENNANRQEIFYDWKESSSLLRDCIELVNKFIGGKNNV